MLGGSDVVAPGRIHHHDAALGGRLDIDVIDPDPGATHDTQIGRGRQRILSNASCRCE